jgi:hypothetical protein
MIANNAISHDGFVARSEITKAVGAKVLVKIAYNYATAQEALTWLNSPTHKVTIEGDLLILDCSTRNTTKKITLTFCKNLILLKSYN